METLGRLFDLLKTREPVTARQLEALARLGERDPALVRLLEVALGLIQKLRANEIRAMAALVAGDVEGFLAIVAKAERPAEGGFVVKAAVEAALQAGREGIEPVLARLEPVQLAYRLNALGLHQSNAGEAEAALATLARLIALGKSGRLHGDFRDALARLLLQSGRTGEAVALAVEGNDPHLIAGMLPQ